MRPPAGALVVDAFRREGMAPPLPVIVIVAFFALAAALSTWARREWIVRRGELTFDRRFVFWSSARVFRDASRNHVSQ